MSASSLPPAARISTRDSTGKSGSAESAPNSNVLANVWRDSRIRWGRQLALVVDLHPAIPEERPVGEQVERGRRVPRDECAAGMNPRRTETGGALSDRQTAPIAGGEPRQVTGHAGDVLVSAQNLIEGQHLTQAHELGADRAGSDERADASARGQGPYLRRQGAGLAGRDSGRSSHGRRVLIVAAGG